MKNYSQIIELDDVTLHDCLELYEKNNTCTIINDGHIITFKREEDSNT